jgi:putative SOS response-associated peptidase YedK
MCGRFNVSPSHGVQSLLERLRVEAPIEARRNIAPGAHGQFVVERQGRRELLDGVWSLLIEPRPAAPGFRPDPKFSTFNARSDRLEASPLWRRRFHSQRCIVPADGFHEWVGKHCHNIAQEGRALALGGLYELWDFDEVLVPSFTVITVPPHPRFAHIHTKSLPLMLEPEDFDLWLDPAFHHTDAFRDLLRPRLRHALVVTPVASPVSLHPDGESEIIVAD